MMYRHSGKNIQFIIFPSMYRTLYFPHKYTHNSSSSPPCTGPYISPQIYTQFIIFPSMYRTLYFPHVNQILPKLPAPHTRLTRLHLEHITRISNRHTSALEPTSSILYTHTSSTAALQFWKLSRVFYTAHPKKSPSNCHYHSKTGSVRWSSTKNGNTSNNYILSAIVFSSVHKYWGFYGNPSRNPKCCYRQKYRALYISTWVRFILASDI
jgi:hypothetical protein